MTVDKEAILVKHVPCTCSPGFKSRDLDDPDCPQHSYGGEIGDAMDEYAASLLKENEGLKKDGFDEAFRTCAEIERLKSERDKFEGGDELKAKKIIELEAWKESAMSVMSPMQEIGKAIGVKLGESIHDKILPAIKELQSSNEAKEKECEYWKQRCEAAEAFADGEYWNKELYEKWQQLKNQENKVT